jgi:predicted PurR-regulated permease PerM
MHSIRNKIQSLLIISIVIVAICAFGVLYVNQQSVTQNQKIIDRMTAEYSIMSQTDMMPRKVRMMRLLKPSIRPIG